MSSQTRPQLTDDQIALLRERTLAHVATVMPDGSPQVTPVWVDTDGEAVLFNTAVGRVKQRNLSRDPRVAISLADRNDDHRTVVIRGRAEITEEGLTRTSTGWPRSTSEPSATPSAGRVSGG